MLIIEGCKMFKKIVKAMMQSRERQARRKLAMLLQHVEYSNETVDYVEEQLKKGTLA